MGLGVCVQLGRAPACGGLGPSGWIPGSVGGSAGGSALGVLGGAQPGDSAWGETVPEGVAVLSWTLSRSSFVRLSVPFPSMFSFSPCPFVCYS